MGDELVRVARPRRWKGYRELIPKDDGFERRFALYEAYHQLNHSLFPGGIERRVEPLGAGRGWLAIRLSVIRDLETGLPAQHDVPLLPIHPLKLSVANLGSTV